MKLSVVIPCYNEVETIYEIVQRVRSIEVNDLEVVSLISDEPMPKEKK